MDRNYEVATAGDPAVRQYDQIRRDREPQPKEPALLNRMHELLGYLNQMEGLQSDIRAKLHGRVPSSGSDGMGGNKRADEPCLDELLATACTLAANLVGEQKTILGRI